MKAHIVVLPGDGVGPEVSRAARAVLETVADRFGHDLTFEDRPIGGAAIDEAGDPLPAATTAACLAADAIFLGAVGGPRWTGAARRPEEGLLQIRQALGLFANLRPVRVDPAVAHRSPLKKDLVEGTDLLIVRELTGGLYFGEKRRGPDFASDLCVYSVQEIERIARVGFRAARARRGAVASIDKANVLETSRLWRETVTRLGRDEFPDVTLEHALVDSAAMRLVLAPKSWDVILTENLFGDILSDEASVLGGSIGLLGSASLGQGGPGLFEPIHGSAPDIAGTDKANPVGAIAAAAMLLRDGLALEAEARSVETAIAGYLAAGELTADLGGRLGTTAAAARITERIASASKVT